jgi:drug/metabolite transporter (DMT)-like permease
MLGGSGATIAIPLALGAAVSFAIANVAQMRATRRVVAPAGINPRLLVRLASDRQWLTGLAASVVGFLLQGAALFLAPVLLVQPLIVTELLFALPLAAALAGVRLHRREWAGVVLVAAGISAFVAFGRPRGERTQLPGTTWLAITASLAIVVVALVALAESRRNKPMVRASLLAFAASVCFGFLSVLTKVVGHQFDVHGVAALARPQPWLLAIAALTGLLLQQSAFRIAPLSVSLPIIDVGEPVVASLLAALAFGETIALGIGTAIGVGLSGAAVIVGIALLDTSPIVQSAQLDLSDTAELRAPALLATPINTNRR